MASQNINVGTNADDGTGESLRSAFIDIRKMFAEVYGQTYTSDTQDLGGATFEIDSDQIVDGAIDEVHLNATNSPSANQILQWDGSTGFTWVDQFDGDITSVVAGDGLTGGATDGDATLNVNVDDSTIEIDTDTVRVKALGIDTAQLAADAVDGTKIADDSIDSEHYVDGSIDTAHIADDQITHDKLEGRYTEDVSITTYTGTVSFDCSSGSVFKLGGDLTGAYTIDLTSYKKGQIITIYPLKGNQTLNLDAQGSSTNTFNKIGGVDYEDDGTSNNILQIECVDDSSTDPVFFYSLATYASASSDI